MPSKHAATYESELDEQTTERMRCMEVRGGNDNVRKSFAMPGLDVCLWSKTSGSSHVDGGDLHFLSSCASGRITRLFLADICGTGPAFKNVAVQIRDLMARNVNSITQARLVRRMHQRLRDFSTQGALASALITTFLAPTRSFSVCNAGHPPPLVRRHGEPNWNVLRPSQPQHVSSNQDDVAWGVLDQEEYQQYSSKVNDGDLIFLYSNALAECRNAADQTLGVYGLVGALNQITADDPLQIGDTLLEQLGVNNTLLGETDATAMICQGNSRAVGWKNNLLAPFRLLGSVGDHTQLS